jgi:hypothetical protein
MILALGIFIFLAAGFLISQSALAENSGPAPRTGPPPSAAPWPEAAETYRAAVSELGIQTGMAERKIKTPIPKWVFIAAGSLAGLILLTVAIGQYLNWTKTKAKKKAAAAVPSRVDTGPLLRAGAKADALFKQGQIVLAMHTLLLETIEELKKQKNQIFPISSTSREIVSQITINQAARETLLAIVTMVEPTWFGSAEPHEREYTLLRERFTSFLGFLAVG